MSRSSKFNDTLASLADPTPADFDPEALEQEEHLDDQSEPDSDDDTRFDPKLAREHYVAVGKSKLRLGADVENLGAQYRGARVSRDKLNESDEEDEEEEGSDEEGIDDENGPEVWGEDEDIDSDEALGEGDEERFEGFKFKGSRTTKEGVVCEAGMRVEGSSSEEEGDYNQEEAEDSEDSDASSNPDQSNASDNEDEQSESEEESNGEEAARRNAMSKLLAQEETTVKKAQSTAAQSEATKGKAIMQQQKAFDAILSARIKFQPALQSVNSLPAVVDEEEAQPAYKKALELFNTITELRSNTLKRKLPTPPPTHDADSSLEDIFATLQTLSAASLPTATQTLEKWSQKTTPVSTAAETLSRSTPRSLTKSISDSLTSDLTRHLSRTQIPRACAPGNNADSDPSIFDDTDFYGLLLRALVDQRSTAGEAGQAALEIRDTKKRKKTVDTKASKGRKMRYQVHEKLVGFVAPVEGWERWRDEQREELFAGLLGQRAEREEGDVEMEEEEEEVRDTGLRLFA